MLKFMKLEFGPETRNERTNEKRHTATLGSVTLTQSNYNWLICFCVFFKVEPCVFRYLYSIKMIQQRLDEKEKEATTVNKLAIHICVQLYLNRTTYHHILSYMQSLLLSFLSCYVVSLFCCCCCCCPKPWHAVKNTIFWRTFFLSLFFITFHLLSHL